MSKTLDTDVAIDISGFKMQIGKIWRFVKWDKTLLFKNSNILRMIGVQSKAVLSVVIVKSKYHAIDKSTTYKNAYKICPHKT